MSRVFEKAIPITEVPDLEFKKYVVQGDLNIDIATLDSSQVKNSNIEQIGTHTNLASYNNDFHLSYRRGAMPLMRQQLHSQKTMKTRTNNKCPGAEVTHLQVQVVGLHKLDIKPISKSLQVSNISK